MTLLKHEIKMYGKTWIIWSMCIGICCFSCLLLFESLKESMEEIADMFSVMGGFSAALGMDKVSIGTITGFYATEVALIFALGGAMFAAMTGVSVLSKEEEGHTADFLHTLPLGRGHIVLWKYASVLPFTPRYSATSAYFARARGWSYCEKVPIFVGASEELKRTTSLIRRALATPWGR